MIAPTGGDRRAALEDAVRDRLGNACDVLVLTPKDFTGRLGAGEPVVREIRADGVALVGDVPRDLGHRHVADQPMTREGALAMHGWHAIDHVPDEPSHDPTV